jgi:phosphate uptake regulator
MIMEVANEPPHLYLVEKKMQVIADKNNEIPEYEFFLREGKDEIAD